MLTRARLRLPAVLRDEPQYRLLFASQVLSVLGDRVTMVALPFAVLFVGGGVGDVATVSVAQFLPFVLLAVPAGVWADRWDRKRILITSDAVRLVSQAVAATLLLTGTAEVWHLVVSAAVFGAADAFFAPAFSGLLPTTVSPVNIQPANALRGLTFGVGSVLGPALAGGLVALSGPGGALLFDAVTFGVSLVLLLPLRPRVVDRALADTDPAAAGHFWSGVREGWSEVRRRRWVLGFLLGMSAYHVVVLPSIFVIGPVLMEREYDGAASWALVTVGFGVGSLLGELLLLRWRPRFALRVATLMLVGASCQAAFIGSGFTVPVIALLELAAGICVTCSFTLWETSLGEHVPEASLSRVSSYDYLSTAGMIPLGNVLAGAATTAFGLHPTLVAMTVLGVGTSTAIAALPSVRRLPRGVGTLTA